MGNESSVEMNEDVELQAQGDENLWSIHLQRGLDGEEEDTCIFSRILGEGSPADQWQFRAAIEHLRVLRHPNIIKFLGSEMTEDSIYLFTEPLVPILRTLQDVGIESVVMGCKGVGTGLDFLHRKVGLSHNNVNVGCVYVNVTDSQWKLGGFEAAASHKTMDTKFISSILSIRDVKAIPPEDESPVETMVPIHSRDVWGFGHFMLTILEDTGLEAQVPDSSIQYINDEMLNPDPQLRPTISDTLTQPWMSNQASLISDFLSHLTLKNKTEKDIFFRDLMGKLYTLPPLVVAEHIVPLLINPLVMAEPLARESLWKHLLLPITAENPRLKVYDPSLPCPLLNEDLYKSHVIPLLLNLMESREYHVRFTLLPHIKDFASLCTQEDLVGTVLPEVLIGLRDNSEELVQVTLHALGDLIPHLGADLIMGTSRKQIFTDAQPRANVPNIETMKSSAHSRGPPIARKNTPPLSRQRENTPPMSQQAQNGEDHLRDNTPAVSRQVRSREDRLREMKEKREQQRLKRMAQTKLGHVTSSAGLTNGDSDSEAVPVAAPLTNSFPPQYSPSISHDEVEGLGTASELIRQVKGESSEGESSEGESSEGESSGEEWEEFEDKTWHSIEREKQEKQVSSTSKKTSKLILKPTKSQERPSGKVDNLKESMKGRLSAEDIERLEIQSSWAKSEPDLFADMAPKISRGISYPNGSGTTVGDTPTLTGVSLTDALQYQPKHVDTTTSGDWASEDWNDNF